MYTMSATASEQLERGKKEGHLESWWIDLKRLVRVRGRHEWGWDESLSLRRGKEIRERKQLRLERERRIKKKK